MWRLYGDDGKGSCIRYDVNYSLVDNKEFFLAPVSYGKDKDDHPELELIIAIKQLTVNGWKFRLNRWRIWKHFLKSYLFRDESEVRLLYKLTENLQDNAQWIMDSTNKIVSRIFLLRLVNSNFPLKLKSATIGPKCPEQMCNVDQFNYMNTIQNVFLSTDRIPGISASKIEDYR